MIRVFVFLLACITLAQFSTAQVDVIFNVDMSLESVSPDGVHLAGDFNVLNPQYPEWDPAGIEMFDDDGDGIYSVTLTLMEWVYEYKYINGDEWGEDEGILPPACASDNDLNRSIDAFSAQEITSCYRMCCAECPDSGVVGCMNMNACNYNPTATVAGSCDMSAGCSDPTACNYSSTANCDDGTCTYFEGDSFYADDFSNCSLWMSDNASNYEGGWNDQVNWECGTGLAPAGDFAIDPINSPSYDNGILMIDSDLNGFPGTCENAWITSDYSFDLTSSSNVLLGFRSFFRHWEQDCDMYCLVEISRDGITWPSWDTFEEADGMVDFGDGDGLVQARWHLYQDFDLNDQTANSEWTHIDISEVADGEEIWIRFRWSSSWGFAWMIDDLALYPHPNQDMQLHNPSYTNAYNGGPFPYSIWHPSQSTSVDASLEAYNNGLVTEDAEVYVWNNEGIIGNTQQLVASGETLALTYSHDIPTEPGSYHIEYSVGGQGADACGLNGQEFEFFDVSGPYVNSPTSTGGQYAKDNGIFTQGIQLLNTFYSSVATEYEFFGDGQIHSVQAAMIGSDCESPITASIVVKTEDNWEFTWVASSTTSQPVPPELMNTEFETGDQIKWMTFAFDPPIDVAAGDKFMAEINIPSHGQVTVGLAQQGPEQYDGFVSDGGDYYWFNQIPMIRFNMDPASAEAVTETCQDPTACNYDSSGLYNDESLCVFNIEAELSVTTYPSCGQCDGVMEVELLQGAADVFTYQWYNAAGDMVFDGGPIFDAACEDQEYYVVIGSTCDDVTTNSLSADNVQDITFNVFNLLDPAACGTQNIFMYYSAVDDETATDEWISDNTIFYLDDEANVIPATCGFGECNGSIEQFPIETTTYTLGMIYTDVCGDTHSADSTFTINVIPPDFELEIDANPTSGDTPLTVTFDNQTPNDENYTFTWDFGDGTVVEDNGSFVQHTYESGGLWDVTLTAVDNETGCVDVLFNEEYIWSIGDGCPQGCTDPDACNYDSEAECDDGSCLEFDECGECGGNGTLGCMDSTACNYDSAADCDDGSCLSFDECGDCGGSGISGCMDTTACNYNASATCDDGSCAQFDECGECGGNGIQGCTNANACNYEGAATCDDGTCYFAPEVEISGANVVTAFTSESYSVILIEGAEYEWTVTGGVVEGADDGYEVSIFWAAEGLGELCVTVTNGVCDPVEDCIDLVITPDDTVTGCTDSVACNYDPEATTDNGNCVFIGDPCNDGDVDTVNDEIQDNCECEGESFPGCMNPTACNYDSTATSDDGSCFFIGDSCDDQNPDTVNDTIQDDCECEGQTLVISGCTDSTACNYNPDATDDDGSCVYLEVYTIVGSITPVAFATETYTYTETAGSSYEWIITGGVISSGQGSATIEVVWSAAGSGSLSVQETDADGCVGEVVELDIVILPTDIEEIEAYEIEIYPNPASDAFTLEVDAALLNSTYRLHDVTGKLVDEGRVSSLNTQVDVSGLADGQYSLVVVGKDGVVVERVVVGR